MNTHPLISIIVPLYNLDSYIDKCLNSIHQQTYTHWECIIINDNSTDSSEEIAKKWCDKDKRFKYVRNLENKGLSETRNIGIRQSKGSYISFIDNDDWVEKEYLQYFVEHITDEKKLLIQDIIKDFSTHSEVKTQNYKNEEINIHKDIKSFLSNYKYTQGYAWNKLYSTKILLENSLYFKRDVANEDEIFYFEYIQLIDKIHFLEKPYYHYIQRENSMSRTPKFPFFYLYTIEKLNFKNFLYKNTEDRLFAENYIKNKFNHIFHFCLKTIYANHYTKKDRINYLNKLYQLLNSNKDLINYKVNLFKKIYLILLTKKYLNLVDYILIKRYHHE